ncbi:hypothetical protein N7491_004248 [Penicillium cf. griseofulvum]|uniref:Uncharacterized protein n=1 Tax=Penicillium cf. griseofulvum TaxID=2972120 RepID=A0A9W9T0Q1_9EURO|nr:hypothetical protein N7472_001577 [Penicillium cf. griseofulvum]KAJ5441842.1 hypothetical protein N7491_004248 [Penicillium cf. griseofulvum]
MAKKCLMVGADEKYKDTKVMYASPAAALKQLLGKSTDKEDMWLFVSARIPAAGMIKIKHGQLRSLAPLRAFHHALQQQGVDMSHVSMSKSYIRLAGIEGYTKTKRKAHAVHEKVDNSTQKLHQSEE